MYGKDIMDIKNFANLRSYMCVCIDIKLSYNNMTIVAKIKRLPEMSSEVVVIISLTIVVIISLTEVLSSWHIISLPCLLF